MGHLHNETLLSLKKEENFTFVTAWMDLESIMLSEISQSERQLPYDFTYMWNLMNKINKQNRNRLTDIENRLIAVKGEGYWKAG